MTRLLTIVLLFTVYLNCFSQENSTIQGRITDADQKPLSGVNVLIAQLNTGTQSNAQGDFSIENLSAGNYTLTISYLGFKTQSKQVSVQNDGVLTLGNIVLYEGNEILNEVVINGERQNKFSRKKTAYVAKLPLKDIENTQVYSTVTNELLESQVVTNFEDALNNAVGIEKLWTSTGRGGDGAGYYSLRGFSVQPQLVNGLQGLTNGTIKSANIERI